MIVMGFGFRAVVLAERGIRRTRLPSVDSSGKPILNDSALQIKNSRFRVDCPLDVKVELRPGPAR